MLPPRARQVGDEAIGDGNHCRNDDRDCPRSPASRLSGRGVRRHDDVDVETHYVSRELGKAFGRAPPPASFDADVATFDVSEVTKSRMNAFVAGDPGGAVVVRTAIRGTFTACCASAASGAARRHPGKVPMNARRSTRTPHDR